MRVLVIEDNPKMASAVEQGLREQGYSVSVTDNGEDGEHFAVTEEFDVVILDLMLPDCDGVELCRRMRKRGVATPILMLTALASTQDKVAGLDAGADDYLAKPFDFDELLARVRALLRRCEDTEAASLEFGPLKLDLAKRTVHRGEDVISLTTKEFALLEYFMRNPERVLSRSTIGQHVWDMNFEPTSNVIDVYLSTLRRKVDKPYDTAMLHTVIGSGYMLSQTPPAG